jgi:hypothetical protein
MRKGGNLTRRLAAVLLTAPVTEPAAFGDRDGGLRLSYGDYRSLERNVTAPREYAERPTLTIDFYREDK